MLQLPFPTQHLSFGDLESKIVMFLSNLVHGRWRHRTDAKFLKRKRRIQPYSYYQMNQHADAFNGRIKTHYQ